jgi:hypothetical protein
MGNSHQALRRLDRHLLASDAVKFMDENGIDANSIGCPFDGRHKDFFASTNTS